MEMSVKERLACAEENIVVQTKSIAKDSFSYFVPTIVYKVQSMKNGKE
jgi:hypothetical protein